MFLKYNNKLPIHKDMFSPFQKQEQPFRDGYNPILFRNDLGFLCTRRSWSRELHWLLAGSNPVVSTPLILFLLPKCGR